MDNFDESDKILNIHNSVFKTYTVVFTNQDFLIDQRAGTKWYPNVNNMYKNILTKNGYNIIIKNIREQTGMEISRALVTKLIETKTDNEIFILNPIDFAGFFLRLRKLKKLIFNLLDNIKYIVLWQEILMPNFEIIGYTKTKYQKEFVKKFFNRSMLNVVSNLVSINSLVKNNIHHNKYFTITGYSHINDIVPIDDNGTFKDIDIFIYGNNHPTYIYRNNLITGITNVNNNKYTLYINNNIYGEQLDYILKKTKIVLHIPSHKDLEHMPWPKITYLQSKKIFFIVEDNAELHANNYDSFIPYYKRNDIMDMFIKIDYYLKNESVRHALIEKNYNFIAQTSNMDVVVPNLIKEVIETKNIIN